MLLRTYGLMWNPELVDWGSPGAGLKGRLVGEVRYKRKKINIDVWAGTGIYVLYNDFQPVYAGKALGMDLGARVRNHLSDRLVDRWDSFSFYLVNKCRKSSNPGLSSDPTTRGVKTNHIVDTLESLIISIANPPLNRRHESLPKADEVSQVPVREVVDIHERVRKIYEMVEKMNGDAV